MSKIVILSHWRVGSTNFKKTLEQITGQEFWNEPDFDKHKNTIQSMGFEKFIENKYGSVSAAMSDIKHYYQIVRAEVPRTGVSERIPEVKVIVDLTTYNALDVGDRSTQTVYEFEEELNDNKREIKLINADFIQDIDYKVKTSLVS